MVIMKTKIIILFLWVVVKFDFATAQKSTNSNPHQHPLRHHTNHHHLKNAGVNGARTFPASVCRDRRYWQPLPSPAGVIGFGYNIMTGKPTSVPIFNISAYDDEKFDQQQQQQQESTNWCRLTGHRSITNGSWNLYRLPGHVESYTFLNNIKSPKTLNFSYVVYNSSLNALLDAQRQRSLATNWSGDKRTYRNVSYDQLYLSLPSAPIRYVRGAKSYLEAMEDLADSQQQQQQKPKKRKRPSQYSQQNQEEEDEEEEWIPPAPILYTLKSEAVTGQFALKSFEKLSSKYLHDEMRRRLRQLIVSDNYFDFDRSEWFFDVVGTNYAVEGTFGAISERWWISRRRPERKCDHPQERPKSLDAGLMAACDRFRLIGDADQEKSNLEMDQEHGFENSISDSQHNTSITDNNSTHSNLNNLAEKCQSLFEDERFRTSRWMVTSGGPADRLFEAHVQQLAFGHQHRNQMDQQQNQRLSNWLSSLNEEPSTISVRLAPICDLIQLIDRRPWHQQRCREQLINYIRAKDPFHNAAEYARNSSTTKITSCPSSTDILLKFERSISENQNRLQQKLTETELAAIRRLGSAKNVSMPNMVREYNFYCVSTANYIVERTCKPPTDGSGYLFSSSKWCIFAVLWSIMSRRVFD